MRIELADVTVRFGDQTVLEDIHLTVAAGERVALLGPSGAGKTTLLRVIVGAVPPVTGWIRVDGLDPFGSRSEVTALRRSIGCVRQRDDLVPGMTARTNILAAAAYQWRLIDWLTVLRGAVPRRYVRRLTELARRHEIEQLLPASVERLSGGQRQRVALVRALLTEPLLLLADEATSGLDPVRAAEVIEHLLQTEATVVATTHDLAVASCFERVVALRHGRVVFDGAVPEADDLSRIYGRALVAERVT
ncbi:phosphonate transport system ATP-binding protein [Nonomuraea polychroma]|uniref:Phosphonate transport system ATP-binding protein n=1 Tax=Nonomuraea polychroma TaxID=46176 RepID=A0A438M2Q6_9ACTN|nr:ATP-binding cassette domain-containing protein [Nonomuraea polychroma]RVX39768.1 phosphonate transport system ATP-binding protein [Nonomuraea polychroma]